MSHDIPTKCSSNRSHLHWLSSKLKKCIKKKHKLMQLAKKKSIPSDWTKYKQHKSITQKLVRQAHWNYVTTILNKSLEHGNNKPFCNYIKARHNDNIGVAAIKNNGILYHDSKTKAELISHQFKSVFTMDDDTDHLSTMSHPKYPNIENITISIEGAEKLLDNINIHKASGPDKIQNIIFKTCSKEISAALANIFQQSLDTCTLPNDWRNANISPILFKGNKHMASNYRPISLTSVCCKNLEHIICKHMLNHLENNNIISPLQHGFSNGHSCESQLILTMHDIMQNFDQTANIFSNIRFQQSILHCTS